MTDPNQFVTNLIGVFGEIIFIADAQIGENRNYSPGIGPHHEGEQIAASVEHAQDRCDFDATIATAATDSSAVEYPSVQAADPILEADDATVYIEAKLFRFQKGNDSPSNTIMPRCSIRLRTAPGSRSFTTLSSWLSQMFVHTGAFLGLHLR